jgi:hypothetical protein
MIACELKYLSDDSASELLSQAGVVGRELNALIAAVETQAKSKSAGA